MPRIAVNIGHRHNHETQSAADILAFHAIEQIIHKLTYRKHASRLVAMQPRLYPDAQLAVIPIADIHSRDILSKGCLSQHFHSGASLMISHEILQTCSDLSRRHHLGAINASHQFGEKVLHCTISHTRRMVCNVVLFDKLPPVLHAKIFGCLANAGIERLAALLAVSALQLCLGCLAQERLAKGIAVAYLHPCITCHKTTQVILVEVGKIGHAIRIAHPTIVGKSVPTWTAHHRTFHIRTVVQQQGTMDELSSC